MGFLGYRITLQTIVNLMWIVKVTWALVRFGRDPPATGGLPSQGSCNASSREDMDCAHYYSWILAPKWRSFCRRKLQKWRIYALVNKPSLVQIMACRLASNYLNQCCNIVNQTLGNKLRWNLNRNLYIFIQENAFENIWKWQPYCLGLNVLIMNQHWFV